MTDRTSEELAQDFTAMGHSVIFDYRRYRR